MPVNIFGRAAADVLLPPPGRWFGVAVDEDMI
jgi:hypothetical protein